MRKRVAGIARRPPQDRNSGCDVATTESNASGSLVEAAEEIGESPSAEAISLVIGQGCSDTPKFGRLIRERRLNRKLSAQDLGPALGVSPGYVRAVERGDRAPAPDVAVGLLKQLGMYVAGEPLKDDDRPDLVFSD